MDYPAIPVLLNEVLCLRSDEGVVFVHDEHFSDLRFSIKKECEKHPTTFYAKQIAYDGSTPPSEIKDILTSNSHEVFIFGLSTAGIWHLPERKIAKYDLKKRLANFVCSPQFLEKRLNPLPIACELLGIKIRQLLSKATQVRITSNAGTDIRAKLNRKSGKKYGPFLEAGHYCSPGTGGDYPLGEVGFGPELNSINGKVAIDYKIQHVGFVGKPIIITVENDEIVNIDGHLNYVILFQSLVESHISLKYMCEISIGLNPNIEEDYDIRFIPEEKMLGTIHLGFGGNYSYGDREGPHFDAVIKNPTLHIDDDLLLYEGRFNNNLMSNNSVVRMLAERNLLF